MSPRLPWWGTVTADILLLDAATLGTSEVRARAIAAWEPGSTIHELPDGLWALHLGRSRRWRAEEAPGMPLVLGPGGRLRWTWRGVERDVRLDQQPVVALTGWVDLTDLPIEHLTVLETPVPPEAGTVAPPAPPAVNLPRAAGVARDPRAAAVADELLKRSRGQRGRRDATGATGTPRRNWIAELVLRSPTGAVVARRHARYLRELTRDFERRDFDAALRRAIALTGQGGTLSLRLPAERGGALRPRTGPPSAGRALGLGGPAVENHLRQLYRDAAQRLEASRQVEAAAFVHADLLGAVADAVGVLERHRHYALGAALAEGRDLPSDTAVRLWWLAGQRERARDLARSRGSFALVAERLPPSERAAWRRAWLEHCRAAGDPVAAVRAAWPEAELRPEVHPDLTLARSLGGSDAAEMLALSLADAPDPADVELALGLLTRPTADDVASRLRFVETLRAWPVADPAIDRRLATEALRLLVREPRLTCDLAAASRKRLIEALRNRADPLAAADLPRPSLPNRAGRVAPSVTVVGAGHLPVLDAAVTTSGVLVALGDHGVRLCGPEGQVRARWDVPASAILRADHGAGALLAVGGEELTALHRLDLSSRRVTPSLTLRVRKLAGSFDGAGLIAADDRGVVLLDTTRPLPARELWRHRFGPGDTVVDLARSDRSLAAVIRADGSGELPPGLHLWRWTLPDLMLRARVTVDLPTEPLMSAAVTADGMLVTVHGGPHQNGYSVRRQLAYGRATMSEPIGEPLSVVAGGAAVALVTAGPDGLTVTGVREDAVDHEGGPWTVVLPGAEWAGARVDGTGVTAWTPDGRVAALDTATSSVTARFATSV